MARFVLLGCLGVAYLGVACSKPAGEGASQSSASYEVRALLRSKQQDGPGGATRLQLAHEAIPTFRDRSGKAVGMPSMTMAFGVASGVEHQHLQVGDKLRVRFAVRWQASEPLQVVRIDKLPADTELKLEDMGKHGEHDHNHAQHEHGN